MLVTLRSKRVKRYFLLFQVLHASEQFPMFFSSPFDINDLIFLTFSA